MKLGSNDIGSVYIGSTAVNKIYIGSTEVWSSFTGLLDDYSGAAAAYSLRLLSSTYSGDSIRVRRASDNAESNIGFVDGQLDTSTLETFCSGTDGFVTTWYDQSGNGRNATQTTSANQPKIVSSGSTITENGKPTLSFDGADDGFSADNLSTIFSGTDTLLSSLTVAHSLDSSLNFRAIWGFGNTTTTQQINYLGQNGATLNEITFPIRDDAGNLNLINGGDISNQSVIFTNDDKDNSALYQNSTNLGTSVASLGAFTVDTFSIGYLNRDGNKVIFWDGNIQELILYPSDQSSNRTGIESNINNFYNIY